MSPNNMGYTSDRTTPNPHENCKQEEYILPLTFLRLIIQSIFIPPTHKPLSALLIAKAGLGKTIKLERLRKFDFVYYTVDITPKKLLDFLDKVERGEKKFLVIPDYIATLGHSKKTVDLFRSLMRSVIEEGLTDIDAYGLERHYGKKVRCGLISGITPEYFNQNSRIWKSDGFLSRFLPFSYSHTPVTITKVLQNIRMNMGEPNKFEMKIKTKKLYEPEHDDAMDVRMQNIMYKCGLVAPKEAPYRAYIQIRALCQASAILRDSKKVELQDIELIELLSRFFNRNEAEI